MKVFKRENIGDNKKPKLLIVTIKSFRRRIYVLKITRVNRINSYLNIHILVVIPLYDMQ